MRSWFYKRIISQIATDVGLDDLPADSITWNKIFILALRAPFKSVASSHFVHKNGEISNEHGRSRWKTIIQYRRIRVLGEDVVDVKFLLCFVWKRIETELTALGDCVCPGNSRGDLNPRPIRGRHKHTRAEYAQVSPEVGVQALGCLRCWSQSMMSRKICPRDSPQPVQGIHAQFFSTTISRPEERETKILENVEEIENRRTKRR